MNILVLGGDGYLGWPTAMHFSAKGHRVCVVDNYLRRTLAIQTSSLPLIPTPNLEGRVGKFKEITGRKIQTEILDCSDFRALATVVQEFQPDAIIHYAEQPSAPYSMRGFEEARLTLSNNLTSTFNVLWAIKEYAPDCHLIKLGTMGEYGTPNIDIEEGWLDVQHNGRTQKFLYPRQAGSLYHTTKVLDTDLIWFYVRLYDLRVTDLMQGPVYGLATEESALDNELLPNFHYDDIFGTVVNRFLVQAVSGIPLTVYGKGGQTRGYLNLKDTLQCVDLAFTNPASKGELKIFNQFTEQFTVNELAEKVKEAALALGLEVGIQRVENPRKESEEHYYNARHEAFSDLGLRPTLMSEDVLVEMLETVLRYKENISIDSVLPRVRWR